MASLHLSLAALAFFTVPIGLYLMSMPLGFHADVDLLKMAVILGRTILIPIILGMAVRYFFPRFADTAGPRLDKAGGIGLLVVVLIALAKFYPLLLQMDPWSYLVMVVVSAVALAIGHWLGPRDPSERTTLAVESGVRHPVLAITIAASNFTPERSAAGADSLCARIHFCRYDLFAVAKKEFCSLETCGFGLVGLELWR